MSDISLFLPSLALGGAERVAVTLSNEFAHRGMTVDLVCATATGPYVSDVGHGIELVDFAKNHVRSTAIALRRYLKRQQPRVLFSFLTRCNLVASAVAPGSTTLILTEHRRHSKEYSAGSVQTLLARRMYRRADWIVGVSSVVVDEIVSYLRVPSERVVSIMNPVDHRAFRAELFEYRTQPPNPSIIFVGRLSPEKEVANLLGAFAQVRETLEASLTVVGTGPEYTCLRERSLVLGIDDHVSWLGRIEEPWILIAQASVLVVPSSNEAAPNVIHEAMAVGTPVVATDSGGPREMLVDGEYGEIVPVPATPSRLAEAIIRTIAKPPDPARLRKRASAFAPEKVADRYLELTTLAALPSTEQR